MMKRTLTAALLCGALTACSPAEEATVPDAPAATTSGHDHSTMATHGGSIGEIGDHVAMMEVLHDETAGRLTVYLMDAGGEALAPDAAPVVNIPAEPAPVQVTGVETDGAWVFEHDALKGHADGVTRMRVSVGGKSFNPEIPHTH